MLLSWGFAIVPRISFIKTALVSGLSSSSSIDVVPVEEGSVRARTGKGVNWLDPRKVPARSAIP
jgi:hypothetical protein